MSHQQQKDGLKVRDSLNLGYFIARVHEACIAPFMRSNFGDEYLGFSAFFGLILMLLVAGGNGDEAMFRYILMWLAALILQKGFRRRAILRGRVIHGMYIGDSELARLPFVKNKDFARFLEVPLCLLAGVLLMPFSEVLGKFVMLGAVSIFMCRAIEAQAHRVKLRAMRDAQIEGMWFQEEYRKFSGRR